jgi:hypothetical protein
MQSCPMYDSFTKLMDQNIDIMNEDMRRIHLLVVKRLAKQLKLCDYGNNE